MSNGLFRLIFVVLLHQYSEAQAQAQARAQARAHIQASISTLRRRICKVVRRQTLPEGRPIDTMNTVCMRGGICMVEKLVLDTSTVLLEAVQKFKKKKVYTCT